MESQLLWLTDGRRKTEKKGGERKAAKAQMGWCLQLGNTSVRSLSRKSNMKTNNETFLPWNARKYHSHGAARGFPEGPCKSDSRPLRYGARDMQEVIQMLWRSPKRYGFLRMQMKFRFSTSSDLICFDLPRAVNELLPRVLFDKIQLLIKISFFFGWNTKNLKLL